MEKNNKKNTYGELLSLLHTKAEADHFISQIDILSQSLFTKKTSLKDKTNELFSSDMATSLIEAWKQDGIDGKNIIELQNYLGELKEVIKHTPILNITIAFKPKQATTQRIFDWVQSRLKKPVFLDIKVEKQIIGGAIIEFHGRYFEYSLHKALSEKMFALSDKDSK